MSNYIANQLEEIQTNTSNLTESPFYLFGRHGKPFYTYGKIKGCSYKIPFFTLKYVDCKKQLAVLNIHVPFPFQEVEMERLCCITGLIQTKEMITVDLSHFSGVTVVSIPTIDSTIVVDLLKEEIYIPFQLSETDPSQIIWNNDDPRKKNTTTIVLCYHEGNDSHVKVTVNTKEKIMPLIVSKGKSRVITVKDLLTIEILTPTNTVQGTVEVLLNRTKKRKIYFN